MKIELTKNLPNMISVGEAAERIYPDITYDTALPQQWVDAMQRDHDWDPRGQVVWGYPQTFCKIGGCPLPLTMEAADRLADITGLADAEGAHPWDSWMEIIRPRMGDR